MTLWTGLAAPLLNNLFERQGRSYRFEGKDLHTGEWHFLHKDGRRVQIKLEEEKTHSTEPLHDVILAAFDRVERRP